MIEPSHARKQANISTGGNSICLKYRQCHLLWVFGRDMIVRRVDKGQIVKGITLRWGQLAERT